MIQLYLDIAINLVVFLTTAILFLRSFFMQPVEGKLTGVKVFRFFTTLSNVFAGIVCFLVFIEEIRLGYKGCFVALPTWVHLLKFMSTAAVSLTLCTVLFFLGPTKGYKPLFKGSSFYMHLVGPILSIVSLCFLENQVKISLGQALLGVIPTILYGAYYLYQVIGVGEENGGWPDLYGFNRNGKWQRSLILVVLGSLIICLILMAVHNL